MRQFWVGTIYLLLMLGIVCGGDLNPSDPPGSTMKTLEEVEPRTPLETLSGDAEAEFVIDEPGAYYLTGDIFAIGRHGIKIDADDVTVDLMGYRIESSYHTGKPPTNLDFAGISVVAGRKRIRICKGTIWSDRQPDYAGFKHGIYAMDSGGVYSESLHVENISVVGSRSSGMYLTSHGNIVRNCQASGNDIYGIGLIGASTVEACSARNNGNDGIHVVNSTVVDCYAASNTGNGFWISASVVVRCRAVDNEQNGFNMNSRTLVTDCVSRINTQHGIKATDDVRIVGNSCTGNDDHGIYAEDYCILKENVAYQNDLGSIAYGTDCVVSDNIAH